MSPKESKDRIVTLLREAEIAERGSVMARLSNDGDGARRLQDKANHLRNEAASLRKSPVPHPGERP